MLELMRILLPKFRHYVRIASYNTITPRTKSASMTTHYSYFTTFLQDLYDTFTDLSGSPPRHRVHSILSAEAMASGTYGGDLQPHGDGMKTAWSDGAIRSCPHDCLGPLANSSANYC